MQGGKNKQPLGYTIIEVMLFLAISGMMFVMAASMVNGKQAKAEFKDGVNAFTQQIQITINEVTDGNYPAFTNATCQPGSSVHPSFVIGNPPATYGGGCVFVGKAIQLAPKADANHPINGANAYNVFTLIGNQRVGASIALTPTSLHASYPLVLDAQSGPSVPNLTTSTATQYGLSFVEKTGYTGFQSGPCSNTDDGVLVFGSSFGKYDTTGSVLQSGAQSVQLYCLPNALIGSPNPVTTANSIISMLNNPAFPGTDPVTLDDLDKVPAGNSFVICVTGGKGDYASITVGANTAGKLTTSVQIGDTRCTP